MLNFRGIDSYINAILPDDNDYDYNDKIIYDRLDIGPGVDDIVGYRDRSFDVVIYSDNELKDSSFIQKLEKVSRDLIFISIDRSNNSGNKATEVISKYSDTLKIAGYHILFLDPTRVIVFKRKISDWNSRFLDMLDYVKYIVDGNAWDIESIVDCGTGQKGVVGQMWYENEKKIKRGFACDIWTIKAMSDTWKPLKMNALDLLDLEKGGLKEKSVDVVQAFGFLEHLDKEQGYRFLQIAEKLARKLVIVSAATFIHGMSSHEKADADGNPYHRYNSVWHWDEFRRLGYQTNYEDMRKGVTFSEECICWKVL